MGAHVADIGFLLGEERHNGHNPLRQVQRNLFVDLRDSLATGSFLRSVANGTLIVRLTGGEKQQEQCTLYQLHFHHGSNKPFLDFIAITAGNRWPPDLPTLPFLEELTAIPNRRPSTIHQ